MTNSKKTLIIVSSLLFVVAIFAVVFYVLINTSDGELLPQKGAVTNTQVYIDPSQSPTTVNNGNVSNDSELEQKVSQMIMVSCHPGIDIEAASEFGVGGICLYTWSFEDKSSDEVVSMIKSYQNLASVPMLVSTDEEGGSVIRASANEQLRSTPFLSPSQLKAQGGIEAVISDTIEKSDLLLSLGVNVNLAPVCDVPLDETNYIFDRCYSLDHEETSQYASAVVSTMKQKRIGSCLKHFPGYGGSVDTHQSMSYDNREYSDFENGDFKPFISGINAGADSVLVSHNIVGCMDEAMPASLSKPVHDILRDKLNFDGVIITDDLGMEGIQQFTDGNSAAVKAIKAGNDMIICNDYENAVQAIVAAVKNGEISESQIDESVARIVQWKKKLGLM